jgi:hypothetical protein
MRLVIALDTASTAQNPFVVNQPFDGVYVETATDNLTTVKLSMGSLDTYQTDNYVTLTKNCALKNDFEVKGATLTWSAQAGKTITVVFFLGASFTPGSLISAISGGVNVLEGSTINEALLGSGGASSSVSVTSTATQLLPTDSSRIVATLNFSSPVNIGDSSVTATTGLPVPANTPIEFRNTGALYAITAAGTSTCTGIVEK